ncbi:MAG: hypothetical protein HY917_01655, partial [Candidatus Diapherotrites archaeon]|nr:hypothetical protein [Candidatus Diapherotrites archaeon]
LQINPLTNFSGSPCNEDLKPEGDFVPEDWSGGAFISQGRFVLVNASDFLSQDARVCVFRAGK